MRYAESYFVFDEPPIRLSAVRYYIGMLYLHMKRILHRDLRCGNVLISHNWHAKIGDFNLACTFDEPNKKSHGASVFLILLSVFYFI